MIISKSQVQIILRIYARDYRSTAAGRQRQSAAKKQDKLRLAKAGRLKQKALLAVKQIDDIRLDRVITLQQSISTGSYKVTDHEIAEKMIQRVLVDNLV
ncbi:MAG: flagellar biosynthesis anti-sigma factor FlgM [Syntrophomonadaceae bacterium]|jgi:negative regulator of flagellin synthesis FlgM|nr:flagellar biosynthesis anti-sigma factor FlgM [Syntrophomonadaceae bacterium]